MKSFQLEILQYSYYEHFKFAKDLALVLPIDHPKRKLMEEEVNKLQKQINDLQHGRQD